MASILQGLFGGQPQQPRLVIQPSAGPPPAAPTTNDPAAEDAARKERFAQQQSIGRSGTILTDFALAMQQPTTLKKTLGGA